MAKIQGKGTARAVRKEARRESKTLLGEWRYLSRSGKVLWVLERLTFAALVGLVIWAMTTTAYTRSGLRHPGKPGQPTAWQILTFRGADYQVLGAQADAAMRVGCLLGSDQDPPQAVIVCLKHYDPPGRSGHDYYSVRCDSPIVGPERTLTLICGTP